MKYIFLINLFSAFLYSNHSLGQFDGLWIDYDNEMACIFENEILYSINFSNWSFRSANRIKFKGRNKLKIGEPNYYLWVEENRTKTWYIGKYFIQSDTIQFILPSDTICLIKSKYELAIDHVLNNIGLEIDLPKAESIRYLDFSSYLKLKIYIGFDSLRNERIIIDGDVIENGDDFLIHVKKYQDKYETYPYKPIMAIIYCDQKVSMEKIYFIEKLLFEEDIRRVMYAAKYLGIHPLDLDIVGITLTLNDNVLVESED